MIREKILEYGPQVLLAIIVWFAGIKLISLAMKLLDKTLTRSKVEVSLKYFLENVVRIILKILLALSVLAMIGVETTSFLAALGAAGLAIGLALQ
jgi:small conductance mechanosensitive channel